MTKVIQPKEFYKNVSLENLDGEIWKDIKGYEGLYQISNMGRVKALPRYVDKGTRRRLLPACVIKIFVPSNDYVRVRLTKGGQFKMLKVHRLVGNHFVPNPENKPYINHKRGIKTDNRASELEWCTNAENLKHAGETGLMRGCKGEKSFHAKLTEEKVLEIRKLLANGVFQRTIAEMYNVHFTTIGYIHRRQIWSHI